MAIKRVFQANSSWRISAFYFLHFFGVGVTLPFLNIYYHSVGITALQLGWLNAAARISTSLVPPVAGVLADRIHRSREVLFFCVSLSALVGLTLWWSRGFWAFLVLISIYSAARGAIGPIAENISLRQLEKSGGQYGRLRWWGSLGFIVAALGVGKIIEMFSMDLMFPILFISAMALLPVVAQFPSNWENSRPLLKKDLENLFRTRPLLHFYGSATLMAVSAGPFGLYFSIYLRELGMSAQLIGLAWTIGVVSEIFFLWFGGEIQKRIGLNGMIMAGIFATALRWECTILTTQWVALIAIQALHGITFGVYHAAAVQFVDRWSAATTKNTGQALYVAATFGIGSTAGVLLAGCFFSSLGFVRLMHVGAVLALLSGGWFAVSANFFPDENAGNGQELSKA